MSDRRTQLLIAVSVNAVPIAGVLWFDWSLAALLLVYWVELGIDLAFAALRGLFAQRPSEATNDPLVLGAVQHKRGGVRIPGTRLSIQIANVPVVLFALPAFGGVWAFVGAAAIGGAGQAISGSPIDEAAAMTFLLGICGVFVGRGYETVSEYFLAGEYENASVQRALQSGIWPVVVVGTAMAFGGVAAASGLPPSVALAAAVGGKSLFDVADVYRDRLVAFDERDRIDLGFASEPDEWPTVETDLQPPVDRVRPARMPLLIDGVVRGLSVTAVWFIAGLGVLLGGVFVVTSGSVDGGVLVAQVVLLVLAVAASVGVLDRALRYLTMEYRVGRDVVGYDRLFGAPQWRVPGRKLAQDEVDRTLADRLCGTETVVVEHDGRELRLPHLDGESALEPNGPVTEGVPDEAT
ncbi:DUF6498-containing protein [Haloarcula salina]|uniref:Uncharacterized protein n=1 Tax=Haloarcula salina TaxID=1429914 RepID=A0AA41KBG1_9EURY|nr:DUF6498-containing protein [Haloarcula salina]MBV0901105.1 hypothetical protein [Haloarcula salina]